jgi:hypothetical protein
MLCGRLKRGELRVKSVSKAVNTLGWFVKSAEAGEVMCLRQTLA